MIRTLLFAALVVTGVAVGPATAQPPEVPSLISPVTGSSGSDAAMPEGVRHINYNSALARSSLRPGSQVQMPLPDGANVILNFEKSKRNPSGSVTWVGRLADTSLPYKAIITDDGEHVFGRIVTPEGEYLLRTVNGVQQLLNPRAAGLEPLPLTNDEAVFPVRSSRSADHRVARSIPLAESAEPGEMATIDVLLAYSTGLANELGDGLQTRLDYLIALANQAYEDSEIRMRVRVVHTVEVDYSDTESTNVNTLVAMTPGTPTPIPSSLAMLPGLRNTYGADLVAFIRRFQYPEQVRCGSAWVAGDDNAGTVSGLGFIGYSVGSDGFDIDASFFCNDFTLAHVMGHNMGSSHDRANAKIIPVFPYSYGYGFSGEFGTVMSYINPAIAMFSNPDIDCLGQPCGIADPDPASADNARSINNTRFEVAAFRATAVPESCTPEDILTLENTYIPVVHTEIACTIAAGPNYTVSSTAEITFSAIESIMLRPGFRVEAGGQFTATVDPGLVQ